MQNVLIPLDLAKQILEFGDIMIDGLDSWMQDRSGSEQDVIDTEHQQSTMKKLMEIMRAQMPNVKLTGSPLAASPAEPKA